MCGHGPRKRTRDLPGEASRVEAPGGEVCAYPRRYGRGLLQHIRRRHQTGLQAIRSQLRVLGEAGDCTSTVGVLAIAETTDREDGLVGIEDELWRT